MLRWVSRGRVVWESCLSETIDGTGGAGCLWWLLVVASIR